ncbi:oxidoreductase [Aspergillus uvarum CBS 121591]|uniref:Oxidoreductase n=1 Tax=Aspergillus uvarum CBS 121591 TaxID=1448315 RepID=A0A319C7W4_9EURO|nr:oxidoreductase [Aspergillus uvarum CBS 121591]PYH81334.1 oxidoreductase [Aspergillus uvarum CBS 121591]
MTVDTPSFTAIPVLDYALATSPATKSQFLASLRHALVHVGFFYLINAPIAPAVRDELIKQTTAIFDLPLEKKLEIEMVNSKHFLGYSRLGAETTARQTDYREQFDFATELPPPSPDAPLYRNIRGPNQWPDESAIPGFRRAVEAYLAETHPLAAAFRGLISEALDMAPTALDRFFEDPIQQKLKLIKYPPPRDASEAQGVGAHKDSEFLTFLLQATPHTGLEVQNKAGEWVAAPPLPGSLVVNIGRALEAITGGVCTATTHRVNLAMENFVDGGGGVALGPRFSIPVFQGMSLDLSAESGARALAIPAHIRELVRDETVRSDAEATFNRIFKGRVGEGTLIHRVMSHQDVGRRWYPALLDWALAEYEK